MTATPRVLVIGATGPTGRAIVARGRADRWIVRALARRPSTASAALGSDVDVVQGDVLAPASIEAALDGMDVVISALGTPLVLRPVTLLSAGTRHIVDAMRRVGVARLLCITGMGAGDSRGHGGFVYDRLILPTLLRQIYADKDRQEAVVRESALDWVVVRPARLTDGLETGQYRTIARFEHERMTTISRANVAHFIAAEVRERRFSHHTVNLTDETRR